MIFNHSFNSSGGEFRPLVNHGVSSGGPDLVEILLGELAILG